MGIGNAIGIRGQSAEVAAGFCCAEIEYPVFTDLPERINLNTASAGGVARFRGSGVADEYQFRIRAQLKGGDSYIESIQCVIAKADLASLAFDQDILGFGGAQGNRVDCIYRGSHIVRMEAMSVVEVELQILTCSIGQAYIRLPERVPIAAGICCAQRIHLE